MSWCFFLKYNVDGTKPNTNPKTNPDPNTNPNPNTNPIQLLCFWLVGQFGELKVTENC